MDGVLGRRVNPIAVGATLAFGAHQIALARGLHLSWADSYLDPWCSIPVMLGIPSMVVRYWRPSWSLPWVHVAVFSLVIGAAFEYWIPQFDPRFTGDPLDLLGYFGGAWIWRRAEPKGN